MRRRRRFLLAVMLVGAGLPVVGHVDPAGAQQADCTISPETLDCDASVTVPAPDTSSSTPDTPGDQTSGPSSRGGPSTPPPPDPGSGDNSATCSWQTIAGPAAESYRAEMGAPADAVIQICAGGDGTDGITVRWVPPGADQPAAPADPAVVAATLLAQVRARMVAPEIVADPPMGTPSIITLPVFIQVTNWLDGFTVNDCVGAVCVEMTATPTLTFEPGEPGAAPVTCEPPGTRFDPAGPDPAIQAGAPGACAYTYTERTGAAERPDEWPARVVVTWNVAWTATGGAAGQFDPMSLSTPVPRAVDEVQTVVVDGENR